MISVGFALDRVIGLASHALHVRSFRGPSISELEPYLERPTNELFPLPAPLERMRREAATTMSGARGERTVKLSWESGHTPLAPSYVARHEGEYRENLQAAAWWTHSARGPKKRALIYVHGWLAPVRWVEGRGLVPKFGEAMDADTLYLQLPFHGARKPRGELFHGEFFWTADLVRSMEAVRQSVHDVRALAAWLRTQGYDEVGVTGVSLGASLTMLTATVASPPDYIIPIVGHLQLSNTVERAGILWRMKADLERAGVGREERAQLFSRLGIDGLSPSLRAEKQLWVMASEDAYIQRADVERQWRAWGEPMIEWIPGGHMTFPLGVPRMVERMREFRCRLDTERRM